MPPAATDETPDAVGPGSTFAILLGASVYPHAGTAALDSEKFGTSARRFKAYLETALSVPASQIRDLFDVDAEPNEICDQIAAFLGARPAGSIRDLVVYYVGHGDSSEETYCLFLRRTDGDRLLNTALSLPSLKEALGGDALPWRLHFVIDACYSSKATDVYQSGGRPVSDVMLDRLPTKGISFLCSANREHRSLTPGEASMTMFTGALLDVLEGEGDGSAGPRLSAHEVCELTRRAINRRFPDKSRTPEIFSLRHRERDMPVTHLPFYPNPARRPVGPARQVRDRWDHRDFRAALAIVEGSVLGTAGADEALSDDGLAECLGLLAEDHDPLGVVPMFFGLTHASDGVRRAALNALLRHDWAKVADAALGCAKRGDAKAAEVILDGLYASKARQAEVDLLNQLATAVPAGLRPKARRYLGEKELRLTDESIRARFERSGEPYRIKQSLGPGTLTSAYLAVDTAESDGEHEEEVVLRILDDRHAGDAEIRDQFVQRGRQSKAFHHTNLVSTFRIGSSPRDRLYYTVHSYFGKYTLRDAIDKRKKPGEAERHGPDEILLILRTIALALMPFHQAKTPTAHCGVRPSNIFLRDSFPDIVLGDPSPLLGPSYASFMRAGLKEDGRLLDYVGCTAPEVYRGEVAPRADFYSLGCVAYELMCGEPPFEAEKMIDVLLRHGAAPVEPPGRHPARHWANPFGDAGDRLVLRFLGKKPEERPSDIAAVLEALEELKPRPQSTPAAPPPGRVTDPGGAEGGGGPGGPVGAGGSDGPGEGSLLFEDVTLPPPGRRPPSGEGAVPPPYRSAVRRAQQSLEFRARRLMDAAPAIGDTINPVTYGGEPLRSLVDLGGPPAPPEPRPSPPEPPRSDPTDLPYLSATDPGLDSVPPLTRDPGSASSPPGPGSPGSLEDSGGWPRDFLDPLRRYRLVRKIGQGGMGKVYQGYDTQLDRDVAIKVINRDLDPRLYERFMTEARALARLRHPGICQIYDIGHDGETPYITMQLVEGRPLQDLMKSRPWTIGEVASLIRDIAGTIGYAHDRGILHRDLKPGNIIIEPSGNPMILDFGLARVAGDRERHEQTLPGMVMGTPAYMAPEQAQGEIERVDERSDLYSLGVILYELLAGRKPFEPSGSMIRLLYDVMNREPEPPGKYRKGIPTKLEEICLICLAKDPADRFASAAELAAALERFTDLHTALPPVGASPEGWQNTEMDAPTAVSIARIPGRWSRLWGAIRRKIGPR